MVQPKVAPLGNEQNPVKLAFGPSADAPKVLAASQELTRALERETGLRFKLLVPTSYPAAIEGMATTLAAGVRAGPPDRRRRADPDRPPRR